MHPALFTTKLRSYYLVAQTIRTVKHVREVEVPILIYAKMNLCFPRERERERERENIHVLCRSILRKRSVTFPVKAEKEELVFAKGDVTRETLERDLVLCAR